VQEIIELPERRSKETGGSTRRQTGRLIQPSHGWSGINWREIWRYRQLLYFLIWRDVRIRYRQTVLGPLWTVVQPVMTMVVFTVLFGRLAGLGKQTGGVPYPIYVYLGLLPWTFFANAISRSSASLLSNSNLISKVYFPRLILPLAAVGVGVLDLGISFAILFAQMLYYGTEPSCQLVLMPFLLFATLLAAVGVGTLLAALTVAYRDLMHAVPFMLQLWMFLTPVIYPSTLVPEKWRWVHSLNPMVGLIDGFRAVFLARPLDWREIGLALAISSVLFLLGIIYFRRTERRFADVI